MMSKDIDFELKKKYSLLALKWCREHFGINTRKRTKLKFILTEKTRNIRKSNSIVYGRYCFWRNTITIYGPNCKKIEQIVSTIIHEYTHYLQSRTKYKKYEKTHYYSTHPLERSAFRNEQLYTKQCMTEIKKLINN